MAWQYISPEVTVKSFKKCCISSAVDETDNGMLWNGSEEDWVWGRCRHLVWRWRQWHWLVKVD